MAKRCETYWEGIYKGGTIPESPSLFAQFVLDNYLSEGDSIIELGCGNGRDACFFARNKIGVIAVDQCDEEIEKLSRDNDDIRNLSFKSGDFTNLDDYHEKFDAVYSRFTLHSVGANDQQRTLEWAKRNLKTGGRLCIETRGMKNELYQQGTAVAGEPDAFILNEHYRRFVDFSSFVENIEKTGFTISESHEDTGFAPFEDTDYHFIRVVAVAQ